MMSQAVKGKSVAEVRALVRRFKGMMSIDEEVPEGEPSTQGIPRSWECTVYQDRARRCKKGQPRARPNQRWRLELFRAMSTIPHKEAKPTAPKMIQMTHGW